LRHKAQLDRAFALVLDNSTDFLKRKVADLDTTVGRFESETSRTQGSANFIDATLPINSKKANQGLSELVKKFKAGTDDAFSLRSTLACSFAEQSSTKFGFFPGGDKV